ncbi:uncharacterized protein [Antedon mediterranea]|uniref:uncharacterized protein isoform X2 n=1 Tax=Antedon mediterranea TaxID=105859 RepID=UPI003AF4CC46
MRFVEFLLVFGALFGVLFLPSGSIDPPADSDKNDILPDLPGDTIDNIANAEVPVNEPESCEEGYALSDGVCTDVDECRIANTCPADVGCTNTIGSYNCEFTGELFDSRNFGKEVNVAAQVDRRADGGDGGGGGDSGGGGGGGGGGGPPPPPVPGNVAPAPVNNHHQKTASGEIVLTNWQFIVIIASCVVVGVSGIAVAVLCWYKLHTTAKAASDTEYPAYGVTGPTTQRSSMTNGDRKLAQSAQMYHYQHQKQQMIALENRERGETQNDASDYDSDDNEEPTVYECPGLAPTGQMEVKNPLFQGMEERLQAEQKKDDN